MEDTHNGKAYLAEAVGTFILVFSIIAAVTLYAGALAGAQTPIPNIVIPFIALAHGFALFIGIQTLGAISGGHFNPAVTLGLLSIRKISAGNAMLYMVAQVIGATVAAFMLALVLHDQGQVVKFGSPSLDPSISVGAGIALEALMVFFLVWTIVATAVNPDGPKEWAPVAISTSLALGVLLIGQWTGASLNPARAFGPDLTNALFGKSGGFGSLRDFFLVYVIAPIAAGVLAATLYSSLYLKGEQLPEPPAPSEQSPL
ncbi:MAG: aquaporin [Thermoleophilaceae bacterium]|nr:aquaporin [Thermoleophilaceae bacterium]